MQIYDGNDLETWLENNPDWRFEEPEIVTEFQFDDFRQAFGFISSIATQFEKFDHHPTLVNSYNHIKISMATHDAGNKITDRDTSLAEVISQTYKQMK